MEITRTVCGCDLSMSVRGIQLQRLGERVRMRGALSEESCDGRRECGAQSLRGSSAL